jgi:hypothetical protein
MVQVRTLHGYSEILAYMFATFLTLDRLVCFFLLAFWVLRCVLGGNFIYLNWQAARVLKMEQFGLSYLLQHFCEVTPDKTFASDAVIE